jgi:magnesium transporter
MITIFVHREGRTERATSIDRAWLIPAGGTWVWVDLSAPSIPESLVLSDTFAFHPLSVEDAMASLHYPKIEAYDGYLYIILHGIDFHPGEAGFATHDIDFFLGPTFLVTVHDGHSRSITELQDNVPRNPKIMAEGPVSLFHRIVDTMVEHYRPEVEKLAQRLDEIETRVFGKADQQKLVRRILNEKRSVSALRRIVNPQRDVIARLARREFADVTSDMSFRFRDVYDQLVRIADDSIIFQDRIGGILDAHLSNVNNRLNETMKVLTLVATIFMPLTVLTSMWGMNILLPRFPGNPAGQFWWIAGAMVAIVGVMIVWFRRRHWI